VAPALAKRDFLFIYTAAVTGLKPGQAARIWLPVAPTNAEQEVAIVRQDTPGETSIGQEPRFGNRILYVKGEADRAGSIPVSVTYRVTRHEVRGEESAAGASGDDATPYLQPDALVPVVSRDAKPMTLLAGKELPADPVQLARVLYDVVDGHMEYRKDKPGWGRGDAVWACESGFGNCSDFHSLFISLARSNRLPAKFEIGFGLPDKRGEGEVAGYHCWAWFKPAGRGWMPVDISEANKHPEMKGYYFGNLTPDRVTFSTGRDLTLVPKQDGPAVNFLIYPYVEVDGQAWPQEKIVKRFSYRDVEVGG
jgi:transglutaminase-like putative cysteine protease